MRSVYRFDRQDVGLILVGMPGFERRLARYPQLYSRIGFVHHYRPLDPEDVHPVLGYYQQYFGPTLDPARETDTDAVLTIIRITGGNFLLIERLMTQVLRVMNINQLDDITCDVVVPDHAKKYRRSMPNNATVYGLILLGLTRQHQNTYAQAAMNFSYLLRSYGWRHRLFAGAGRPFEWASFCRW